VRAGAFLFWLIVASAAALGADEPIPVPRPPLRIEITRSSTPDTAVAEQTVAINEKIAEVFQDESVVFDPTENLDQVQLVCEATGETLKIGLDKRSPVYLERSLHKLRKDEPGRIAIRVTDPQSLKPGVYRGQLSAVLRDFNQTMNASIRAIWEIEIAVHGRRLTSLAFEKAQSGKLRVGVPASLVLRVNAVGCDLGEGFLRLDWWAGDDRQRALYLNLPVEKPLDPAASFGENDPQGCHPQWRDSPVWTDVEEVSAAEGASGGTSDRQLELRVAAPDCFLPGMMKAEVTWKQDDAAPNPAPVQQVTADTPVLPGVLAHPRLAFLNERVVVLVRADRDLGETLPLIVSQPDGKPAPVELTRRRQQTGSQGGLVEYVGSFYPRMMGSHQFAWPDTEQRAASVEALGEPPGFLACFGAEQSVPQVEVFAGAPPFWVTENLGWRVVRPTACRFWYSPQALRAASLESVALFRGRPGEQLARHDSQVEPLVTYAPPGEEVAEEETPAKTPQKPAPKKPSAPSEPWMVGSSPEKALALDLTVDLVRSEEPGHPRHTTGEYDYIQRLLIHAQDTRGEPLVRMAAIPLHVKVSTAGQYYRRIAIFVGAALALIIVAVVLWRKAAGPRTSHKSAAAAPDPMAHLGEDGFFSKSAPAPVSGAAAAEHGMEGGSPPGEGNSPEEPEPPPEEDQPDMWD
jgi:hypothetical protein